MANIGTPGQRKFKRAIGMGGSKSPKPGPESIDLEELSRLAEAQAERNIARGIELEEQYDPTVAQFREEGLQGLLGAMQQPGGVSPEVERMLMDRIMAGDLSVDMPELQRSPLLDRVREEAMRDLEMGGQLDAETQNMVARAAAGRASAGGFLGGGMGRDVFARDLGLTSLGLRQQRMGTATQLGAGEEATNLQQQGLRHGVNAQNAQLALQSQQQRLQGLQFLQQERQQEFSNIFGLAQMGQAIPRPVAGLDPGDLASASIADINALNQLGSDEATRRAQKKQADKQNLIAGAGVAVGAAVLI